MKNTLLLACSALAAVALAAPAHKRDIVWVTDFTEVVETTIVVTTVYVNAPESTAQVKPATSAVEAAAAPDTTAAVQAAAVPAPAITSAAQAPVAAKPAPVVAQPAPVVTPSVAPAAVAATPAPEPAPANSVAESPAPFSAPAPAPAPTPAATPAETQASSSAPPSTGGSSAGDYTGDITFYDVGMGSCGIVSTPSENIVALSYLIMSPSNPGNPNNNPNCGRTINITYQGKTTQAKVVDTCAGCEGKGDLDMSYGLFGTVTGDDYGAGRIHDVSWSFAN